MVNSININHSNDEITPSSEGLLFIKENNKWKDISEKTLYKSELSDPDNKVGLNGDYYTKYKRIYNYIKFSSDFLGNGWYSNEIILSPDNSVIFPTSTATKIIPSQTLSTHTLMGIMNNDYNPYTFSLFVSPNEYDRIALSFTDSDEKYGIKVIFNVSSHTQTLEYIGVNPNNPESYKQFEIDTDELFNINHNLIQYEDYDRIWITCQFKMTKIIKYKINFLNNSNQEIFKNENTTNGLFINGAQMVKSLEPGQYNPTNNKGSSYIELERLYTKIDGYWKELSDNTVIYFKNSPINEIGNNGDIACQDAIIELAPIVRFGKGLTIDNKPFGLVWWSQNENSYYVKGTKGVYKLMFESSKADSYGITMALILGNKTYQTYCSKTYPISFRQGFNTGGNYNFFSRNQGYRRY